MTRRVFELKNVLLAFFRERNSDFENDLESAGLSVVGLSVGYF